MRRLLTPAGRRWLYGVCLAAMPLLIAYGLITDTMAPLWVAVAAAILVPGVAIANTTTTDDPLPRRGRDTEPRPRRGRDDDADGHPDTL